MMSLSQLYTNGNLIQVLLKQKYPKKSIKLKAFVIVVELGYTKLDMIEKMAKITLIGSTENFIRNVG